MRKIQYGDWLTRVSAIMCGYCGESVYSLHAYPWEAFYNRGLRPIEAANIALDGILGPLVLRLETDCRRINGQG
jgi:hypothetical protein